MASSRREARYQIVIPGDAPGWARQLQVQFDRILWNLSRQSEAITIPLLGADYGYAPTADEWAEAFVPHLVDLGFEYAIPTSGDTLTAAANQGGWILEPAGELAALTMFVPPAPAARQRFIVSSTETIDAFLIEAPPPYLLRGGGPFVLAADSPLVWVYRDTNTTWYPWA